MPSGFVIKILNNKLKLASEGTKKSCISDRFLKIQNFTADWDDLLVAQTKYENNWPRLRSAVDFIIVCFNGI